MWYDNVAKGKVKGSLLTLLSLKKKEDIIAYASRVDDPNIKECVDKLMVLNENTIKSFWNITPEEDELKLQRTREKINLARGRELGIIEGKKLGISEGKILGINKVAKEMLKLNIAPDVISKATGISEKEIEKLKEKN